MTDLKSPWKIDWGSDREQIRQTLEELLALDDFTPVYEAADEIRRKTVGDEVHIRAIIEFSNICVRQCRYCGLNCTNSSLEYYQMTAEEILTAAERAIAAGYKTIVLQSGENPKLNRRWMGHIVRRIADMGAAVTLSIGELSYEELEFYRQAGARRYLLKHETSDPAIYERLHPCGTLKERVDCLNNIHKLGYETGSGFMVGLPGQTLKTIANDIILLKELNCRMAGIGPFIPHPGTPLAGETAGSAELTRRAVALTRLLIPDANLPVTTALGVVERAAEFDASVQAGHKTAGSTAVATQTGHTSAAKADFVTEGVQCACKSPQDNAFACGANVVMKKITPDEYKKAYEIYPAKLDKTDIEKDRKILEEQIRALGRIPV